MVRLACIDVLKLPLQLLLKSHPDWREHPAALVDRDSPYGKILSINRAARRAGIVAGMRYAAGLSLDSGLRAGAVSPAEVQDCVDALSKALQKLSPGVEAREEEPGIFWLNAEGLVPLYGSLEQWRTGIQDVLESHSFKARIAVGFTRFGTYVSSKRNPRIFSSREEEIEAAMAAPLRILPFSQRVLDLLEKLGLDTVGSFLRLSPGGVGKRFGAETEKLYRFAAEEIAVPLQPLEADEELGYTRRLLTAETDHQRLLYQLEGCLDALLARISEKQLLVVELRLSLILEDAAPRVEKLRPAAPCRSRSLLLELLALRLEDAKLDSGVLSFHLSASCVKETAVQLELFQRAPRWDPTGGARAFARIRAVMGNDAVQTAVLEDEHLPERSFSWKNAEKPLPAREVRMPGEAVRLVRRWKAGARPISARAAGKLHTAAGGPGFSGPYVMSGRWWAGEGRREYYHVEGPDGRLLWVYFDRKAERWVICGQVE